MGVSAGGAQPRADRAHGEPDGVTVLRVVACGSVDDGKSTLLGRLLFEAQAIPDDERTTLVADSRRVGSRAGEIDFALVFDGLRAEREQGITIDVAYRYFSTPRRRYIVADTPGHEQYTRNMVTGASTSDLAVILVDARKGILPQTCRHTVICSLLGVRHLVAVVNKMDLVSYDAGVFSRIEAAYRSLAAGLRFAAVVCIPTSAVAGDNVVTAQGRMPWYSGPSVLECLEAAQLEDRSHARPFRMPVQWVSRPHPDLRCLAGTVVSGSVRSGDRVRVSPSGIETRVERIVAPAGDLPLAVADQAVMLVLADAIDVARGDVLASASEPLHAASQFEATVIWMNDEPLLPGRAYLMKIGMQTAIATVAPLKYRLDVETMGHLAASCLRSNEIGVCQVELDRDVAFEAYEASRDLGGFLLVDRATNATVGAGMVRFALRRAENLHWQRLDVDKAARASIKGQRPCAVWFTGISASGKSTIANLVERRLHGLKRHTYLLDGDNVRHGLSKDLGFTDAGRVENIRRVAEVAKLMTDAGLIVLTAFISPFRAERRMARGLFPPGEFVEVFVDVPLQVAESRDPKGLYAKARRGEIVNFTGLDSAYERPENAEIRIDGTAVSAEQAAELIVAHLERRQ